MDDTDNTTTTQDTDTALPQLPPGARVTEYTTTDGRVGVIVRRPDGKFAKGTKAHSVITSSATARMLVTARHEAARERFAAGLTKAAQERGRITAHNAVPLDAWEAVGQKAAGVLFDADAGTRIADLVSVVGKFSGMVPTERHSDSDDTVTATISAPADTVLAILAELDRRRSEQR